MAANAVVTHNFVAGTPAIADEVDQNFTDITTWINTNAVHLDGTKPFTGPVTAVLKTPQERWVLVAAAATGSINVDAKTASVLYYTNNATGNWTLNFRGDSGTSLDSMMAVNDAITVAFVSPQGSTAYFPSSFSVDGSTVTVKWFGGVSPSVGNVSAIDVYLFTIIKTAAATFTVLGSAGFFG